MRTIQGVGVSAGIAIGTVRVLAAVDHAVERRVIDDPQAEMDRLCSRTLTMRNVSKV